MKINYLELRRKSIDFFVGRGLDIGPFDKPFIENPERFNLIIETVDRWSPDDLKKLFPEIGDSVIKPPTYLYDISLNGLGFSPNENYDFVICSHVIEHVANPFFLIKECYRVLKEGGVLYLAVPDGRYSADKGRCLTTYNYLIDIYKKDVREIPDEKVLDYLRSPEIYKGWVKRDFENNAITKATLDNERLRSFHVHVWDSQSFINHFLNLSEFLDLKWELLDLFLWENNEYEAIILAQKNQENYQEILAKKVSYYMKKRLD